MNNHPYHFEKHPAKKGQCPKCNETHSFPYYEGLPREYGRCERQNSCGYHVIPGRKEIFKLEPPPAQQEPVIVYPDPQDCLRMLNDRTSNFHLFCEKKLEIPEEHLRKWNVGSRDNPQDPERPLTVFIYRDKEGRDLNMRFFEYDEFCKRNKKRNLFSLKNNYAQNTKYSWCLYGEHQLSAGRVICLVESEKTAVIASYIYPKFDWLATGSSNGLTTQKIKLLEGRNVYYICDADQAGRNNSTINNLLKYEINYSIVDLFPGREDGYDLADAIIEGFRPEIKPLAYGSPITEASSTRQSGQSQKKEKEKKPGSQSSSKSTSQKLSIFHQVETYLAALYDIRFNVVSGELEYRLKDQDEYQPLN